MSRYRDVEVAHDVGVFFELYRPSDGAVSDPKAFRYKPSGKTRLGKRARLEPALAIRCDHLMMIVMVMVVMVMVVLVMMVMLMMVLIKENENNEDNFQIEAVASIRREGRANTERPRFEPHQHHRRPDAQSRVSVYFLHI